MRHISNQMKFAPIVVAMLMVTALACSSSDLLAPSPPTLSPTQAAPTQEAPATQAEPQPTAPAPTAAPVTSEPGVDSAQPPQDPCGLPGIQVRANYFSAIGANAVMGPFSGDVKILNTAGGPNIFSMQQASVQRKFVIILKNLDPGTHDLKSTYLSYTEKTSDTDKTPKIWKATSGFLQVLKCPEGGLAIRTVADAAASVGDSVLFQPLSPANNNTASGDMLIGIGGKIQ